MYEVLPSPGFACVFHAMVQMLCRQWQASFTVMCVCC